MVTTAPFDVPDTKISSFFKDEEAAIRTLFGKAESFTKTSESTYECVVPMSQFPGVTLKSKNILEVDRQPDSIALKLLDTTTIAEGPKFLTRIVEAATSGGGGSKSESLNVVKLVGQYLIGTMLFVVGLSTSPCSVALAHLFTLFFAIALLLLLHRQWAWHTEMDSIRCEVQGFGFSMGFSPFTVTR